MNTLHTTEALARKAARRHGRDLVQIIETLDATERHVFFVATGDDMSAPALHEALLYQGPGYLCPREVA